MLACAGQYPGEKEITFPPYTCLEAHGDARLERDAKGNEVIIFPLKVLPAVIRRACISLFLSSGCPAAVRLLRILRLLRLLRPCPVRLLLLLLPANPAGWVSSACPDHTRPWQRP